MLKISVTIFATLVLCFASSASAKDRNCVRDMARTFGAYSAKRICDPKNYVKPDQLGWSCQLEDGEPKYHKDTKGGARSKIDAICE